MDVQDNVSIRIFNNTLVHNHEPSWSHEILVYTGTANVSVLEVKNNLFVSHADTIPLQDDDGSITDHSNNLFFRSGGGALVRSGGTTYTSADIASWEPSAIASDPLLNDISNLPTGFIGTFGVDLRPDTEGLNIAENSPARNAGAALDAAYSGSINSVTRPSGQGWDIGAYEYNEGTPYPDAGVPVDGQIPADGGGADGSTGNGGSGKSGCGCRAGPEDPAVPLGDLFLVVLIFGLMFALRRRRN
jgi:MYXO-CTERM domain-containing protein